MVRAHALTLDSTEKTINVRGIEYRFRELTIGEYDDLTSKATSNRPNPVTGQDEEVIDRELLLRLMVMKSSVEPRINAEALSSLPMRVAFKFNQTVNEMHFGDEPEGEKKEDDEPEEESKGNA
jgi:hypothetical protein